ncbi:MAG: hypothetical protein M1825_005852 [Sarcosagium campestre]|nr:MAG: hypothetical protein M1825_005852 [Sarcosagium campestre]
MAFVPLEKRGREVTWYCCGPTVYDAGHLGHARNYVTTDILRRILVNYFNYHVNFVMNITDIDDKIILRARQQHLLKAFERDHPRPSDTEVVETSKSAYIAYLKKNLPRLRPDLEPEDFERDADREYGHVLAGKPLSGDGAPGDTEAKLKMHLKTLSIASKALSLARADPDSTTTSSFYSSTGDILLPYLDGLQGSSIRPDDYGIFTDLTQYWERKFEEDLRMLNCLPPSRLTRVTEYVPQIADFVNQIVKKGYAYATSDGSVYFDSRAFQAAGNTYARLTPWNRNNKELQADGEGALSKKGDTEKKSDADFALWKASKAGEPSWDSPWGKGRPGWHIECSAMASDVLGSKIDIHSGGIDLAFPHHDNELAQSEAYWGDASEQCGSDGHAHQHDWINYFLHMGHLSIQGSKMSKSLKNFTTIEAALKKDGGWTATRLRIVFLMGGWRDPIEVTDDVIKAATSWETSTNNLFTTVRALLAEAVEVKKSGRQIVQIFQEPERQLSKEFKTARLNLHDALCDSFNTPLAMSIISDLITKTNTYISKQKASASLSELEDIALWITRITTIFGLDATKADLVGPSRIGWSSALNSNSNEDKDQSGAESNESIIRSVSSARDQLRQLATSDVDPSPSEIQAIRTKLLASVSSQDGLQKFIHGITSATQTLDLAAAADASSSPNAKKTLLSVCDELRNTVFPEVGVWLDDREAGQPALVKFVGKQEIAATQASKRAELAAREAKKEAARVELARAEAERANQGRLSHTDMFRSSDEYSAWDDDGIPTRDAKGEEITKSRAKKLRKDWERQKKRHEAWLLANGS